MGKEEVSTIVTHDNGFLVLTEFRRIDPVFSPPHGLELGNNSISVNSGNCYPDEF
ncbi:MAG: hypothetical protein ACXAD7_21580 [Candidatus Kariarchaeaceae archaeon]|jgi:hypothetical protein